MESGLSAYARMRQNEGQLKKLLSVTHPQLMKMPHPVADPGFPVGGGVDLVGGDMDSRGGYVSKILYVKTTELVPLGGARRVRSPRSASVICAWTHLAKRPACLGQNVRQLKKLAIAQSCYNGSQPLDLYSSFHCFILEFPPSSWLKQREVTQAR